MGIASNVPMAPYTKRQLRDYNFIANVAGPAANANANTAALDLIQPQYQANEIPGAPVTGGAPGPYPVSQFFVADILVTPSLNLTNTKNLNISLQHTGALANGTVDTANFSAIPLLSTVLVQMNTNAGAATYDIPLPYATKRFIRAQAALEALGNTTADSTVTLQLRF